MNCKFCNAELQEENAVCPNCGKSQTEEIEVVQTPEIVEEVIPEEVVSEEVVTEEVLPEEIAVEETPKKKVWPWVLAIAGAVLALGALAVLLLMALGVDFKPKPNDIHNKETYTVADEKATKTADTVIAVIGDKKLTNAQLQIYYYAQITDFVGYFGSSLSQIGLDYTKPLGEQTCYFDQELTWEQYFLDIAIETWQRYQVLGLSAEKASHTLSAQWQETLDGIPTDLEQQAKDAGKANSEELVKSIIGVNCGVTEYVEYIRLNFVANDYYQGVMQSTTVTDAEIEAYFTEHSQEFAENGITKDSGLISNVRHILVSPKGGKTDEKTGKTTYSKKEWEACLDKAEKIVKEWKKGEATEQSFAALVPTYTEDDGSISTGGLYEGIYKGSGMVEPFETWSIDANRKPGDVGIVKADEEHYKGYHIIYFVSGEPNWKMTAKNAALTERTDEMIEAAKNEWPMKVTYRKISLAELKLA